MFAVCLFLHPGESCLFLGQCVCARTTAAGLRAPVGLSGQHCSICGR